MGARLLFQTYPAVVLEMTHLDDLHIRQRIIRHVLELWVHVVGVCAAQVSRFLHSAVISGCVRLVVQNHMRVRAPAPKQH